MGNIRGVVKSVRNIMRQDTGTGSDELRILQLGWMLFLKIFSDKDKEMKLLHPKKYISPIPEELHWDMWAGDDEGMTGDDLLAFVDQKLFPKLANLDISTGDKRALLVRDVFANNYNYMKSGIHLHQVINELNKINFNKSRDKHVFEQIYETFLSALQSTGTLGECYTPRAITALLAELIDPKEGEKVLDPACGTGGYLTAALEHLKAKAKTVAACEALQKNVMGWEYKPLPYMLGNTNLILHDINLPNIKYVDSLSKPLSEYSPKDKVDVILANPPVGSVVSNNNENNFPANYRTKESADLFLILMIHLLNNKGRAAIVLPDRSLTGDGVKERIRQKLLEDCNLHTIIRLPNSIFQPYASVATNLLFFNKGEATKAIWFYEPNLPDGYKAYSRTSHIQLAEFDVLKKWWNNRKENEQAWKVDIETIKANGYNLDIKNPHKQEEQFSSSQLIGERKLDTSKPLILLLEDIVYEGVISALRATNRQYKHKRLNTSVENWKSILKYFNDYEIEGVLIKLSARAISLIGSDIYSGVKEELFKKIGAKRNLVLVYENILSGHSEEIEKDPLGDPYYYRPSEEVRKEVFKFLAESNIKVLPYKRNAEVTVMAINFISETEQNLIFRMYIPSGRLWSDESNKIIQLFMDYLNKAAKVKVRLDQNKTDKGVIYEIYSEEVTSLSGIKFSEFSQFMNLCISDYSAAEKMLQSKDIDQKEIYSILSKYSKEAKRLFIDLKHEREQKILNIRQRLESELTDLLTDDMNLNDINLLVDSAIPSINGAMEAISTDQYLIALPSSGKANNLNININSQVIEKVNGIVAQEVRGNQYISSEAQQMLSLINEHAGDKSAELAAAVHELEDKSVAKPGRLNAKQKIKKFLIDIGSKAGSNIAVSSLQKYIENLYNLL